MANVQQKAPVTFRPSNAAQRVLANKARNVIEEKSISMPSQTIESKYERLDLPSKGILYPFDSISIRKIEMFDHAKIMKAVKYKNMTVLLDALNATVTEDIRVLNTEDFRALCYWHRANSYISSPLNVRWTSLYGNACNAHPKKINYTTSYLEITKSEYGEDKAKGFALPTMQDSEVLDQLKEDEELLYMFEYAEFLNPELLSKEIAALKASNSRAPSLVARINKLNEMSREQSLEKVTKLLKEFANKYSFGMREQVTVIDETATFSQAVEYLTSVIENSEDEDEANSAAQELARIDGMDDDTFLPKEEVHALPFVVWSFFPEL